MKSRSTLLVISTVWGAALLVARWSSTDERVSATPTRFTPETRLAQVSRPTGERASDRHPVFPTSGMLHKTRAARPVVNPPASAASAIIGSRWLQDTQTTLADFSRWTERYLRTPQSDRSSLVEEGMTLAKLRRTTLANLIRTDPRSALAVAVPMLVRAQLPPEVAALLEERVSGYGEMAVNCVLPPTGQSRPAGIVRSVLVNRQEYRAYTYGRLATLDTLPSLSIEGIAVGRDLAVSDSPLRVLEPGEIAEGRSVTEICPICGTRTPVTAGTRFNLDQPTAVEVNGQVTVLCSPAHLARFESQLEADELAGGAYEADNQPGTSKVTGRPSYDWTHGQQSVLIIRVDFPDLAATPVNPTDGQTITEDYAVNQFSKADGVNDFFQQASYGQTSIYITPTTGGDSPDVTPVLRMPRSAQSYATSGDNLLLHSDARSIAQAAGYNVDAYDHIGVVFADLSGIAGSKITYGGLGSIIGKNFWINGFYDFYILAHELGHNYGLHHANLWQVSDGNPISPAGSNQEYGDPFDIMGGGHEFADQFSMWHRSILQWIPDSAVTVVTNSGTYRVYRFDDQSANLANSLALKIVREATHDYWIGFRRATTNVNLNDGAYILWGYNENTASHLLDLNTPGTDLNDAALTVGESFTDSVAGLSIHPVAEGGSGADEYLDVQVNFQPRIQFADSTFYADEQSGYASVTLLRQNSGAGAVSVHFNTSDGSAKAPGDYTATNGVVAWADGDVAPKTITIPLVADTITEGAETFTVALTIPSGGVVPGTNFATVIIVEPGAGDPTFAPAFVNSVVNRLLVQPDGRLLIGGGFTAIYDQENQSQTRGGIGRLEAGGILDTNYAVQGGVAGGTFPRVNDLARQPDGKVLLVGSFTNVNGVARNNVARLNEDGSLDAGFNIGTGANDLVNAVIPLPNGKVLLGGAFTSFNGSPREYLVRLNADGTLDSTFNGPDFGGNGTWRVESLALQADGKILVGGSFYFSGGSFRGSFCRLNSDGALDSSFSGIVEGAHNAGDPTQIRSVRTIVPLLDGSILIGGNFTAFNNTTRDGIARLTSTGALDPAFTPTSNGDCNRLFVQPDGKILVGGTFTQLDGTAVGHFGRLYNSGALDPTFTTTGITNTVRDFALQPDGRLLFGSDFTWFAGIRGPVGRFFSGLTTLPGTIQWSQQMVDVTEGNTLTLTATRVGGSAGALTVGYATVAATATTADFTATSGTLSWADGDSTSKTVQIPITADALTEGTETFLVNLGQPLVGSAILGAIQQVTINIHDPITGFASWQNANFTAAELTNAAVSGETADPDQDGIQNILEYAFGLNPKTPDTGGIPFGAISNVGGMNYLTLTYRRRNPAADLIFMPQTAGSPTGAWNADAVAVGSPVNNGDGTETVTYRDSVTAQSPHNQRFMRVLVQHTP